MRYFPDWKVVCGITTPDVVHAYGPDVATCLLDVAPADALKIVRLSEAVGCGRASWRRNLNRK